MEEITYNEQYTQWNKYNSLTNLPQDIVFQKKYTRGYWLLLLGAVLIVIDIILANFVFTLSNGFVVLGFLLAFMAIAAGIYTITQRQQITLEEKSISINHDCIEWDKIERISKYAFQAFGGLTLKNIIIETKDGRKFEFTYNFFNHSSSDIEQLIYMFRKRALKTNVNSTYPQAGL